MREALKRVTVGAGATLAAVTLATTLGASPAQAGWDVLATSNDGGASFHWQHYGEHVILEDNKADGRGAYLRYKVNGGAIKTLYWGGGANTSKDFNLDFAEGTYIDFSICTIDNGVLVSGSCNEWWLGEA